MTDFTSSDLSTFYVAFTVVWGGLALYLVHLHRAEARLRKALERLGKSP